MGRLNLIAPERPCKDRQRHAAAHIEEWFRSRNGEVFHALKPVSFRLDHGKVVMDVAAGAVSEEYTARAQAANV